MDFSFIFRWLWNLQQGRDLLTFPFPGFEIQNLKNLTKKIWPLHWPCLGMTIIGTRQGRPQNTKISSRCFSRVSFLLLRLSLYLLFFSNIFFLLCLQLFIFFNLMPTYFAYIPFSIWRQDSNPRLSFATTTPWLLAILYYFFWFHF